MFIQDTLVPVTCLHRDFNCERNHLCQDDQVLFRILEQQQDNMCRAVDTTKQKLVPCKHWLN